MDYIGWTTEQYADWAPYPADVLVVNNFMRNWGHIFIYGESSLRCSLEKAGFAGITRCGLNESSDFALRDLANEERLPEGFLKLETLTLEATKQQTQTARMASRPGWFGARSSACQE